MPRGEYIRKKEYLIKLSNAHKNKTPWNKGKLIQTNTGRTHFKKGFTPWNKGKIGTPNKYKGIHNRYTNETIEKMKISALKDTSRSIKNSGSNNPGWKGGKSFEPYTTDWTETLRRSIRERDHYICQLCSKYGNTVHHIDYNKKNCNTDNLITLCKGCNSKVNKNRGYWINYFKEIIK